MVSAPFFQAPWQPATVVSHFVSLEPRVVEPPVSSNSTAGVGKQELFNC